MPTDGATHPLSLFMEDTGWPYAPLDDYIRMWDEIYYRLLSKAPKGMRILDIQACFQVAHGSYRRREAMLWQKIDDVQQLCGARAPAHYRDCARAPGARQLHVRGPEVPRSVGEPSAADVGLVTPVLRRCLRPVQDSGGVGDHVAHDVGGGANFVNE